MIRKTLQELSLHDDFMFGAVMVDPENCRCFLERVLEIEIERVEVSIERSFIFSPENKSIRMDVYAKDEHRTHYDIEMQVVRKTAFEKRSRYYHSQMDMEMLAKGAHYKELSRAYVIFVCNFDPFYQKKYRYTIHKRCEETEALFDDGTSTIFLSTEGENRDEVPKELITLLEFIKADMPDRAADHEDAYIKRLQTTIRQVKANRKMGERYMTIQDYVEENYGEELREEGREEGRKEGRKEGREEGRKEGRREGREEGTDRINKLNLCLVAAKRQDDMLRAMNDKKFQKKLLAEFGI